MNINDLNKSQFLLLILLIMIVTSATTAIVTVSLMDQSPNAGLGTTINRVVERTIEKVVPGATTTIVRIVKEVPTPFPNEGEKIAQAVGKAVPSLVKIEQIKEDKIIKLGTGFFVAKDTVVTASKILSDDLTNLRLVGTKEIYPVNLVFKKEEGGVAFLKVNSTSTSTQPAPLTLSSVVPIVGETNVGVVLLEKGEPEIYTGIILGLLDANNNSTTTSGLTARLIRTNAVFADDVGGPILNLSGDVIGVAIARGYALSAGDLKSLIDQLK